MSQHHTHPSPENIMKTGTAFLTSKTLLTAVNFQLFTRLAEAVRATGPEIREILGLKCIDRHLYDFLDALTGLGFLQREGLLETAEYYNSTDVDAFLDKKKPSYIGGILEMMNNRLFGFWESLEEALLTGLPQNEVKIGEDFFALIYSDTYKLKEFVGAMSGIQMGNFNAFAQKFNFTGYKTLTDAGGAAGLLSTIVAKHNPHITCTTFDLPQVEPIALETVARLEMPERVKVASGDFLTGPIPGADIVVMGNILHSWPEEQKIILMKKAYDALPTHSAFVAIEVIIDEERKQNLFGMMMSLNMLIETGNGFDYMLSDFTRWAKHVGFKSTEIIPLAGAASAAIAYK